MTLLAGTATAAVHHIGDSQVHYYKRHLGDYARDTGHLTALEHGVYTLLLDWYYANERPIPPEKTERIARGNPQETQMVLSEFFKLTDEGWVHGYADRVIAEYNKKADRNRESGKLGGRPPKTKTVSNANPQETLTINQEPVTIRESKAPVQPAAALCRFDEFWKAYPNKKAKKDALRHWKREKCDVIADSLMAHVAMMQRQDTDWLRGAVPMGATYLNGRRWEDEPKTGDRPITAVTAPAPVKIGAEEALRPTQTKLQNALDYAEQQYGYHGDPDRLSAERAAAQAKYG